MKFADLRRWPRGAFAMLASIAVTVPPPSNHPPSRSAEVSPHPQVITARPQPQTAYPDISFAAFTPDGQYILTLGTDGGARVWNSQSGTQVLFVREASAITAAALSSDGRELVTTDLQGYACIWSIATGARLHRFLGRGDLRFAAIFSLSGKLYLMVSALSRDGTHLATACRDGTLQIWDVGAEAPIQQFRGV